MEHPRVIIILGSESDEPEFDSSKAKEVFGACGISWELSILSAHRNPEQLQEYCNTTAEMGAKAYICAAGLSAALPGAVASALKNMIQVHGVPIHSGAWQGMSALSAMQDLPPGTVVCTHKFGKHGFSDAAIAVAQAVGITDDDVCRSLDEYLTKAAEGKPPIVGKQKTAGEPSV